HCMTTCLFISILLPFLIQSHADPRHLHSFPTRRSSDLTLAAGLGRDQERHLAAERFERLFLLLPILLAVIEHGREQDWQEKEERSEEHTSELQSRFDLVCRLLLEKKKKIKT